jgi:hypothetical protein
MRKRRICPQQSGHGAVSTDLSRGTVASGPAQKYLPISSVPSGCRVAAPRNTAVAVVVAPRLRHAVLADMGKSFLA